MGFINYLGSLIKNDTGNSSKSFALVSSTILSFLAGIIMVSVLAYDGFKDGIIDTDLEKAGIFMLCIGSCVAASGVPKIFGDRGYEKYKHHDYEDEGEYVGRRRRSMMTSGEENIEDEMVDP
jgi:hypothetical protein